MSRSAGRGGSAGLMCARCSTPCSTSWARAASGAPCPRTCPRAAPCTTPSYGGISFRETRSGGAFAPHQAPTRQFVMTLAGTLEFKTASGATFAIHPGDILLAEDTTGSGHSWRLIDDQPESMQTRGGWLPIEVGFSL